MNYQNNFHNFLWTIALNYEITRFDYIVTLLVSFARYILIDVDGFIKIFKNLRSDTIILLRLYKIDSKTSL